MDCLFREIEHHGVITHIGINKDTTKIDWSSYATRGARIGLYIKTLSAVA